MSQDRVGGDKFAGDKVVGDKVIGTQIKDVAGNVIIQQRVSDKDAARNERIRQHLLEQLQATWIQGVLENSIYEVARLELGLESQPDAVERPWIMSLERPNQPPQTLPPTSKILDTFKTLNGAMLILGEPGSGKTITLLELARELRKVALADDQQPIPLVFNLASWAQERPPLLDWLVGELFQVYGVGRKQAPKWVKSMPFHLLLDGLDEVSAEHRDACVAAINAFRGEYGPVNVVVCSRTAEYEHLTNRLHLMGAAVIQPLNEGQVNAYLSTAGQHLAGIVAEDEDLRELAQTPLTLNIIALAYRDRPPSELAAGTLAERRRHLFTAYVDRMFDRRGATRGIDRQQSLHYLTWLAGRMQVHAQSIYYIEKMQPTW
jgi:predicted NACHT family NTPase